MEDTIAAQEVIDGDGDHAVELDDLAKEGNLFYFYISIVFYLYIFIYCPILVIEPEFES